MDREYRARSYEGNKRHPHKLHVDMRQGNDPLAKDESVSPCLELIDINADRRGRFCLRFGLVGFDIFRH